MYDDDYDDDADDDDDDHNKGLRGGQQPPWEYTTYRIHRIHQEVLESSREPRQFPERCQSGRCTRKVAGR